MKFIILILIASSCTFKPERRNDCRVIAYLKVDDEIIEKNSIGRLVFKKKGLVPMDKRVIHFLCSCDYVDGNIPVCLIKPQFLRINKPNDNR